MSGSFLVAKAARGEPCEGALAAHLEKQGLPRLTRKQGQVNRLTRLTFGRRRLTDDYPEADPEGRSQITALREELVSWGDKVASPDEVRKKGNQGFFGSRPFRFCQVRSTSKTSTRCILSSSSSR